jgi:hypothetical protein
MFRPKSSAIVETGMKFIIRAPEKNSSWRGPGTCLLTTSGAPVLGVIGYQSLPEAPTWLT